ncbi:MAG TPA: hypothetical protein VI685_01350 [Candidatus Angelobacter sp.]
MTLKKATWLGATLLLVAALAARGYSQNDCKIPQSPRNVTPKPFPGVYNGTPPVRADSLITDIVGAATIKYQGQTLYRCDQHYHVPVENTQGCPKEKAAPKGEVPRRGQWIEVHTVYAAVSPSVSPECPYPDKLDHSGLGCCQKAPFVVRGFSAQVSSDGRSVPPGTPIIPPVGRPLAEWTGSNTGPDDVPDECKPIEAQWSFLLSCKVKISRRQLSVFPYAHKARDLQPENRLSKDLTLVGKPPSSASSGLPPLK